MSASFRDFLRTADDPRIAGIEQRDAYSHAEHAWERPPLRALLEGWLQKYHEDFHGISLDEARRRIAQTIAARRMGRPEEFGDACAYLCSAQAGFISGQNLQLDGGSYPGLI